VDDHAAQPTLARRDLRLAARRRDPRGLPALGHRGRELHLENAAIEGGWATVLAGRVTVDEQLEALEALRALAGLPDGQRRDLSLLVAGFRYREIAAMTGGRTFTNVNKHLVRARAAIRRGSTS
jgi:DNA-directed RNA polymerase specialized sigma24 family protein